MAEKLGIRAATRRLILPAIMVMAVLPAGATRHLTVEQLEKTLASAAAKHRTDAEMLKEFGDFDLTERLTDATRNQDHEHVTSGPADHCFLQCSFLQMRLAVLEPPPAELARDAAPDAATQKHILESATGYVTQTLTHLPDFLATRTTYTFNDTAQIFKVNEWPVQAGLHLISKTSSEVTYLDDHVVQTPAPPLGVKGSSNKTVAPQETKTPVAMGHDTTAGAPTPNATAVSGGWGLLHLHSECDGEADSRARAAIVWRVWPVAEAGFCRYAKGRAGLSPLGADAYRNGRGISLRGCRKGRLALCCQLLLRG